MNKQKMNKKQLVESLYINMNGSSNIINRSELPEKLKWTSGDSIFRNDGSLGKKYKLFRFAKKIDFNTQSSRCWSLTNQDKELIEKIHTTLDFYRLGKEICYIKFFGFGKKITDYGVRSDIKNKICQMRCAHCGMSDNIECDHKNDLKNDPRVLNRQTQEISDFQPLCNRCNKYKRTFIAETKKTGKRQGATKLGYSVDFIKGDETFNDKDPQWHIGTYWGDCTAFKNSLII